MTNTRPQPTIPATPRQSKSHKTATTGARALLAALAVSATLGGWALIAHDSASSIPATGQLFTATLSASNASSLAPLPTVIAPLAGLDQIASGQLAPLAANGSSLQLAPLSPASRMTLLRPLARSRSSS